MSGFKTDFQLLIEALGGFRAVVDTELTTFAAYTVVDITEDNEIIATGKDGAVILLGNGGHFTLKGDEIVFTLSQEQIQLEIQDKILVEGGDLCTETNWGLYKQYLKVEGKLAATIEDVA